MRRIDLCAHGWYITPDITGADGAMPFNYFVYGAAAAEVEVDCLTGDWRCTRADVAMDVGNPINPSIDIGQVEGGFVQARGFPCYASAGCKAATTTEASQSGRACRAWAGRAWRSSSGATARTPGSGRGTCSRTARATTRSPPRTTYRGTFAWSCFRTCPTRARCTRARRWASRPSTSAPRCSLRCATPSPPPVATLVRACSPNVPAIVSVPSAGGPLTCFEWALFAVAALQRCVHIVSWDATSDTRDMRSRAMHCRQDRFLHAGRAVHAGARAHGVRRGPLLHGRRRVSPRAQLLTAPAAACHVRSTAGVRAAMCALGLRNTVVRAVSYVAMRWQSEVQYYVGTRIDAAAARLRGE